MMRWAYRIASLLVVAGMLYAIYSLYLSKTWQTVESKKPLIAIHQIIEHHTLDVVRGGITKRLNEAGFQVRILYENAHGSMSTAVQIATKFAASSPSVMVALSTQSAQVLLPVANTYTIPLVFTAVTDPVAAKLTNHPLVTGISDYMEAEPQLQMLKGIVPNLTRLGVIHNPAEVNSVSYLKHVEEMAKKMNIELVYAPINTTSDAVGAVKNLSGKVQAIYFPNDNTAMAAAQSIAQAGHQMGIPVFANDSASVERGCVAGLAYDRQAMGEQTADMIIKIITGTAPDEIPITTNTPMVIAINRQALSQLKLSADNWLNLNPSLKPLWF